MAEGRGTQAIVRYRRDGGGDGYGLVVDGAVHAATGDPFAGALTPGAELGGYDDPAASGIELLPPTVPSKAVAVGLNYLGHLTEDAPGFERPKTPIIFLKPPSCLVGHGAAVVLPRGAEQVEAEAELAVVIGRTARYVRREDADAHVLGLACANDVSARDYQFSDNQWVRAKGFDTFGPVGPVVTGLRAEDLAIGCRVNGEARQEARTGQLLFDVPTLIAFVSRVMTLHPGDLIMTGTPARPPRLAAGDTVEVAVEGLPSLRNPCVAEDLPPGIAARALDDVV